MLTGEKVMWAMGKVALTSGGDVIWTDDEVMLTR